MKQLLIFFLMLAQFAHSQQMKVISVEKFKAADRGGYFYPRISPDNQFILMSRGNYSGLYRYSLADKSMKTLNEDPAAGYKVQISDDGNTVLYTKSELIRNLRHNFTSSASTAKQRNLSDNQKTDFYYFRNRSESFRAVFLYKQFPVPFYKLNIFNL